MVFSTATSIGVQAIFVMVNSNPEAYYSVRELSDTIGCSKTYLNKVLKDLVEVGILVSKTGPGAGYKLAKSPKDIKLMDIISTLNSRQFLTDCFFGLGKCDEEKPCPLHGDYDDFRNHIVHKLSKMNIVKAVKLGWPQLIMEKRE